jgi:hypothetical protein
VRPRRLVGASARPLNFTVRQQLVERFLGTLHRWLGLATIALFLVTGALMRSHHVHLLPVDSALRMLFRSRHIYLLFSGLINVSVGLRFVLPSSGRGSRAALAGSVLTLTSPVLFAVAFFLEPMHSGRLSPVSRFGVFAAFLGVLLYSLGTWRRQ